VVNRSGNAFARRIEDFGGHRTLTKLLWLSSEAMFPFYLAVLVQTSGNPDAIKELTRSCIVPHPLRSDLERLVWFKQRSSSEQRADFPAGRAWSAPSLVRRLCLLNECLLPWCEQPRLRDRVFICYNGVHRTTSIPSPSTFQDALINFIARNRLPAFQLKDIRSSGAVEHHLAAGTVNAAKERLNHKSLATTTRYTSLADRRDEHDRVIRHFQGEIVRLSMLTEVEPTMANASFENVAPGADTVFGFRCKDPWSGLAPGSTPGSPCLQFSRCATCPGALIPVDDPVVVARLLATLSALEETRKLAFSAGWSQRYLALYEPTREILISQVLPAVHPAIKEIAMSLNVCQVVPPLE
jgi:hypothetical protein